MSGNYSARLREERLRIEPKQGKFAQKLGIRQGQLSDWETGGSLRDDQLALLSDHGIDILYVLTGRRGGKLLSHDESQLLDSFRQLDAGAQAAFIVIIDRLQGGRLPRAPLEPSKPRGVDLGGAGGADREKPSPTIHNPTRSYRTGSHD